MERQQSPILDPPTPPFDRPSFQNAWRTGGNHLDALSQAAKRPGKRPARVLDFVEDVEEDEGPEELDLGHYLAKVWGMSEKDQILYCRAYASMLSAKRKAKQRD